MYGKSVLSIVMCCHTHVLNRALTRTELEGHLPRALCQGAMHGCPSGSGLVTEETLVAPQLLFLLLRWLPLKGSISKRNAEAKLLQDSPLLQGEPGSNVTCVTALVLSTGEAQLPPRCLESCCGYKHRGLSTFQLNMLQHSQGKKGYANFQCI